MSNCKVQNIKDQFTGNKISIPHNMDVILISFLSRINIFMSVLN